MKFSKILFLIVFISKMALAQQEEGSSGDMLLYRKETHGGILVHDKGLGVYYRTGIHKTGKIKRFLEFDAINMKHPKEYKSTSVFDNRYVVGKVNTFNVIRTGWGYHRALYQKDQRKGVEVRTHYYAGSSFGILKPVYIDYISNDFSTRRIYSKPYDINEVNDEVYGRSAFSKGLSELKFIPGIYGKFGFSFEYSAYDDVVRAIETGVVLDAYYKKVPIMAIDYNKQFFLSFYLSLVFGKKEF